MQSSFLATCVLVGLKADLLEGRPLPKDIELVVKNLLKEKSISNFFLYNSKDGDKKDPQLTLKLVFDQAIKRELETSLNSCFRRSCCCWE